MNGPLYVLRGVRAGYGSGVALDVAELDIARGGILGLAGHNGSGKTTLLKLLGFLLTPSAGSLSFDGKSVDAAALRSGHLLRRKAALLGQDTCLLKRSVAANVAYGLKVRGQSAGRGDIAAALAQVGLDAAQYAGRPWRRLSGGEARRVALAARLALSPLALLLDEPTTGLDRESAEHVKRAVLRAREDRGTTLVIASHDMAWLNACADRVLTLEDGRIVSGGGAG
jgi:tungstate transport system ATP-binding protein